ncbi:sulfonate ABC transporter ATP-binding protein [Parafrankia soli]|uniref:Sulfonate ABC transporter ATP-binding protein n=1 Tax=Parafrankia soli TaxID=2599596 RepID=A0A1S1PA64_9ACTN|nr:ABC transporter ATP-binding protein [Parafrankia soli]OHV19793.1 sulfonate ABC transporter ATP-binding protein [Parafrankia soli]
MSRSTSAGPAAPPRPGTGAQAGGELAVQVRAARKTFERPVLDGVDLAIHAGEFVALLGASGSGKTTLLRILAGLEAADDGAVWVPPTRTVVFQEPRLVPSQKVWRNVVVGQRGGRGAREAARAALAEVGLAEWADAWPSTLSGGQAQRVALARALVREPRLLLLDEPFAALDALTRIRMRELIGEHCARHRPAVLLVTHDVDEAVVLADRAVVLTDGRISLDRPIGLPRPRAVGDPGFAQARRLLLEELGVHESRQAEGPIPGTTENGKPVDARETPGFTT